MTAADKPAMMEISALILEGNDYLPTVFDAWWRTGMGSFAAVLLGDGWSAAASSHSLRPPMRGLEGLRKDPRVTEKGLAESLGRALPGMLADRPGLASVRFSTYVKNAASIDANERWASLLRTRLSLKTWEGTREQLADVRKAHRRLARAQRPCAIPVRSRLSSTGEGTSRQPRACLVDGWKAYPCSPALLAARYVTAGRCRGVVVDGRNRGGAHRVPCVEHRRYAVRDRGA